MIGTQIRSGTADKPYCVENIKISQGWTPARWPEMNKRIPLQDRVSENSLLGQNSFTIKHVPLAERL